jgi:hypothetical protein
LEPAEWYLVNCDLPLKKIKLSTESTEDEDEEEIGTNILEGRVQNTTSRSSRKIKNDIRKKLKKLGN